MTNSRILASTMSANDVFKSQYQKSLRAAGLVAVLISSLLIWFSPSYTPQPYRLRTDVTEIIEFEVETFVEEPPPVAAAPQVMPEIEAAPNDDAEALETIDIVDFNWFAQPKQSTALPSDEGFVASSSKPRLVSRPKPRYPEVARLAQVEGTVIVKVLVGVDGTVGQAVIVQGVHPLLNNAALKAARQCVFVPGQQRKIKVPTWVAVPYNFRLR